MERNHALEALKAKIFDLLVLGGGITGAGIALIAAISGKKVALIEKNDFASHTSSKSTKLVHGGIRYLQQLDIPMTLEGVRERGRLLALFPRIVKPLPFILPIYAKLKRPMGLPMPLSPRVLSLAMRAGLTAYDMLSFGRSLKKHSSMSKVEILSYLPIIRDDHLLKSFVYYDALTDDALLTISTIHLAHANGAVVSNHLEGIEYLFSNNHIAGILALDRLSNKTFEVRAKHIVNATGVFSSPMAKKDPFSRVHTFPSKGIHVVLNHNLLGPHQSAFVIPETRDGRIYFLVPWKNRTILGTTDSPYKGDLDDPIAETEEIRTLIEDANRFLKVKINKKDIISHFAGLRPLAVEDESTKYKPSSRVSRMHVILNSQLGLTSIIGGKLTTFLKMAEDVYSTVYQHKKPKSLKNKVFLPYIHVSSLENTEYIARTFTPETIGHLIYNYGFEANWIFNAILENQTLGEQIVDAIPSVKAEVIYHSKFLMANSLKEMLTTRLHLAFLDKNHGRSALDTVGEIMKKELGWDEIRLVREKLAYLNFIQKLERVLKDL